MSRQFTVSAEFRANAQQLIAQAKAVSAELKQIEAAETGVAKEARAVEQTTGAAARGMAAAGTAASGAAAQLARAGAQAGMTRNQLQALNYTANDVVASLSSGISPITILMQQGPQLSDAFGGPVQAMRALGGAVGLAGGAILGTVAAAALGVAAYESYGASARQVEIALAATGNRMGLTGGAAQALAGQIASSGEVSERSANDIVTAFTRAGGSSQAALSSMGASVRDYAAATGQDLSAAMEDLAAKIAKPDKGIRDLAEAFGIADAEQVKLIETMVAQGDQAGAQAAAAEIVKASFDGMAEKASGLVLVWNSLEIAASNAWNAMGRAIDRALTGPDLAQQLVTLRAERAGVGSDAERIRGAGGSAIGAMFLDMIGGAGVDNERAAELDAQIRALETAMRQQEAAAGFAGARREAARRGQQVSDLARRLNPDAARSEDEANQRKLIQTVLNDPASEKYEKDQARRALEGLDRQIAEREQKEADAAQRIADKQIREAERAAKEQQRLAEKRDAEDERARADIAAKAMALTDPYTQAMAAADAWRAKALEGLDATKQGYAQFKGDVEIIFAQMQADAYEANLRASKNWADGVARAMADAREAAGDYASIAEDAFNRASDAAEDAFVRMVKSGEFNFDSLVDIFLEALARMAYAKFLQGPIDSAIGWGLDLLGSAFGLTSAGQAWGSQGWGMFSGRVGHTGMLAGIEGGTSRTLPAGVWADAPRFHQGALLASDEVPAILQRGEGVFTPKQMDNASALISAVASRPIMIPAAALGGMGGGFGEIKVRIVTEGGGRARTEARETESGLDISVFIDEMESGIAARGRQGTSAIFQQLEQTYQLTRRAG
jgi:lambda family phage tail tape measure protein